MMCCRERTPEDDINWKITRELKQEARLSAKKKRVPLLLMGAGDSGKSTIAKQMRYLYQNGYETDEERRNVLPAIHMNILTNIKEVIRKTYQQQKNLGDMRGIADELIKIPSSNVLTPQLAEKIQILLRNEDIMEIVQRGIRRQIFDHFQYMLDRLALYASPGFIPTIEDILKVRVRTTGILELDFKYEGTQFSVMDMGGQRSERRKWICFFEHCTAIIFVVALNEYPFVILWWLSFDYRMYDMSLREDTTVNRMHESLDLFKSTINHRHLINTPVILFLNKTDLLREKLPHSDPKTCFEDYTGGKDYDKTITFFGDKFKSFDMNKNKRLFFTHPTCATDTENIKNVFADVRLSIVGQVLKDFM